ncbi:hypothetical protein D3C71_1589860 [compost metagenome]
MVLTRSFNSMVKSPVPLSAKDDGNDITLVALLISARPRAIVTSVRLSGVADFSSIASLLRKQACRRIAALSALP